MRIIEWKGWYILQREPLWTPEFLSMGGTNLFIFMSQYIFVSALPIVIMENLGGGEVEAGLAMTFFQVGTILCRPLAGRIIDSVNKKRLLFCATAALILVMLAFYLLRSLDAIYGLRLVHGVIFSLSTTAAAAMAAMVLPGSRKGEGIGYFALSTNLAMVVGPLVGLLIIGSLGADALFAFMIGLALVTFCVANARRLPDAVILPQKKAREHRSFFASFIEKKSLPAAGLGGLVFFAYGAVLTFIPLFARSLGLQAETSLFFVVFAIVIILTRPFVGRLFDEKGPDYTVYPGFVLFAIGMVLFGQTETLGGLLGGAVLLGSGFGALAPAFQTLAVQAAPPERAGVATATYFWFLDLGVGVAAVLLGFVAQACGYAFLYSVLNTAVILLTAGLYFLWRRA